MDITKYYLDLEKINSLDKESASRIHEYYRDMIHASEDGRKNIATSLFNTLNNNGYLKSIRDEKIEIILDGNNSVNS